MSYQQPIVNTTTPVTVVPGSVVTPVYPAPQAAVPTTVHPEGRYVERDVGVKTNKTTETASVKNEDGKTVKSVKLDKEHKPHERVETGVVRDEKGKVVKKVTVRTDTNLLDEKRHGTSNVVKIAQNLKEGELPSNAEIQNELLQTKEFLKERQATATSKEEARVLRDMHELVKGVQITIAEKNPDNLLQRFLADLAALLDRKSDTPQQFNPSAINETVQTFTAMRSVIPELIKSKDFRRSFTDLFMLTKDLFIDVKNENVTSLQDIPESKKREALSHLKRTFLPISNQPESRTAFIGVINLWGYLNEGLYSQLDNYYMVDLDVLKVQTEAQKIIEGYTGGRSLDNWLLYLRLVVAKINHDQELSVYLRECRDYLLDALNNPENIDTEEGYQRASMLINRGNSFHWKYRNDKDFNNLWAESNILINNMQHDQHVYMLQDRIAQVADDLTYRDKDGNTVLNTDLIAMLRAELIPFFLSRIKEIPIKGFEVRDSEDFEYLRVDDIFIIIDDLLPDNVHVRTENNTDITLDDLRVPMNSQSYIHFKLDGIRPKIQDFYFAYKRRKGLLKEDEGRANLTITGAGLKADIKFALEMHNQHARLGKHTVDLEIDNVAIDILEAKKHPHLLQMGTSIFKGRIQRKVEESIKAQIEERGAELANIINSKILTNISLSRVNDVLGKAGLGGNTTTHTQL